MFDEKNYSPAQLNAVRHEGSNLLLVAGPGSGKTHTMTGRILYLTEIKGIDPSKILVITFTKDAATGMQKRFMSSSEAGSGVVFGTFHSVFYHMICDHKKPDTPSLFFDKAKIKIAESISSKLTGYHEDEETSLPSSKIIGSITVYKNTLCEEKAAALLPDRYKNNFRELFDHYENIRKKNNLMDFDDMVYDCLDLLRSDKSFKRKWSERFSYILIDEFQDINPVQYETVKNLVSKRTTVFAVGDDDQSIYGFRGSDPSCIGRYLSEMKAQSLHLNTNYRSTDIIVNASLKVINMNQNRIMKELDSEKRGDPSDLTVKEFPDRDSQYDAIIFEDNDLNLKRAVLFRTNLEMQYFATYLSSKKIPFRIREKTGNIYEHFILKDIFSYMSAAYEGSEEAIKEIINKPNRYINSEAVISCGGNIDKMAVYLVRNNGIKNKVDKIQKLNILKNDLNFMKKLSPHYALEYLYNKTGYRKYALSLAGNDSRLIDEYTMILEKASEISSMADNYEELAGLKDVFEDDLKRSKEKPKDNDGINLMTVHASKGLEFDKVFIPDCNEGNYPHGKMPDAETVEEERRLFYVGMTRAVKKLYLFYVSGEKSEKNIPSRFIYPLIRQ